MGSGASPGNLKRRKVENETEHRGAGQQKDGEHGSKKGFGGSLLATDEFDEE